MNQLHHTWEEFECNVDICRVTNGAYIELPKVNFMSFLAVLKFLSCLYLWKVNIQSVTKRALQV
jgi:hypothetical protein